MARIAVIDEDKHIRELYYCEFSEIGYEVFTAASGLELMAKLEGFHPDLIVMDIKPGEVDGLKLLREIRSFAPELPVVICSVYDLSRWDIGTAAADWCVVKSFDLTGLKAKVERALEAKSPFLKAV